MRETETMNEEYEPSIGEQTSFSETHKLIKQLLEATDYTAADVGHGVLIAAVSCMRKELSYEKIAEILYEFADDYATRGAFQ